MALSKLTLPPSFNRPRFVRRNVSGATPTLKYSFVNSVTVRHVPLTQMESPRCASSRMEEQLEIVRDVPLPPDEDESREVRAVTATE
jgi:hypothetical protein